MLRMSDAAAVVPTLRRGKNIRPMLHVLPKTKPEGRMGTRTGAELDEAGGDSPAEGHLAAVGRSPPARLHREGIVPAPPNKSTRRQEDKYLAE